MGFVDQLSAIARSRRSFLCVGLDPLPERFPSPIRTLASEGEAFFQFGRSIIEATGDLACAFKPQIAHFAARGQESVLERLIQYIHERFPGVPVILDGKRGDIGSTAELYAKELFDRYGADAATANPYLGGDSLAPLLARRERGLFILCRTSNPGSGDLQGLDCGGRPLFLEVARQAALAWNGNGNAGLVVGATWPEELGAVRQEAPGLPLLVPGVGAQGGDLRAVIEAAGNRDWEGLLINASRSILYASDGPDFAEAARREAEALVAAMRAVVESVN